MKLVLVIILAIITVLSSFFAGVYLVKKDRVLAIGYGFLALVSGVSFMVHLVA